MPQLFEFMLKFQLCKNSCNIAVSGLNKKKLEFDKKVFDQLRFKQPYFEHLTPSHTKI
jgi:hypothetical protein